MRLYHLMLTAVLLTLGVPAHAYLKLTYTSDPLEFVDATLSGQEHPTASQATPPHFQAVFEARSSTTNSAGERTYWLKELQAAVVTPGNYRPPLDYDLQGLAYMTFDSININRIIAWEFALVFAGPSSEPGYPGQEFSYFESTHGNNSCNCDQVQERSDIYTTRPQGNYEFVATMEIFWRGDSELSNWRLEYIEVPEPQPFSLLLAGLGLTLLARRTRVSCIGRSEFFTRR